MRILFVGNHNIGVSCLEYLLKAGHEVVGVVALPEDPLERKYYKSVASVAAEHGLNVFVCTDINDPRYVSEFQALAPELITVVSYRQILRQPIIDLPRLGVINLHGALLPRYRGGSPINWVLINGEAKTGVTIHYIDEGIDTGRIIAQREIPIVHDETAVTLLEKVTEEGIDLFKEVIGYFEAGDVPTRPNRKELGSYYRRRTPAQGLIDWERDATSIDNLIRALVPPFPGAFTFFDGEKIVFEQAVPLAIKPRNCKPGEVFFVRGLDRHVVAAGSHSILPLRIRATDIDGDCPEMIFKECGISVGDVLGACEAATVGAGGSR